MRSSCVAAIGNIDNGGVVFTNDQILSCTFIENLSTLPNGKIKIKVPSLGLDELINLPSGVSIKITISNFEDPDSIPKETTVTLKGTVVKHYSSNGGNGVIFGQFSTYVIEFIVAGPDMSHLQLLKGQALLTDSFGAIKKLGKLSNATILFDDSSIKTQDNMKWLIVNRNLVTGLDFIASRSYINANDALFVSYKIDGTVRVGSIQTSFNKSKEIGYVYANSRFNIVNTPTTTNKSKGLIYGAFSISHASAIKQSMASTGMTMLSLPTSNSNKTTTQQKGIAPTGTSVPGNNKINGNTVNLIARKDAYIKTHPNTHDYYDMAPIIRNAVFSNYSHQVDILASGESVVNVGDVITVMIPTSGTVESGNDVSYSKVLSGKYFVHSKLYHVDVGDIFYVRLTLVKSDINYDTADYKTLFGIDPSRVK